MSTDPTPKSSEPPRLLRKFSGGVTLGYTMMAGMLLFTGLGYWIDRRRGGGVFWTVCGMFAGLVYSAYEVWKLVRALDTNERESRPSDRGDGP